MSLRRFQTFTAAFLVESIAHRTILVANILNNRRIPACVGICLVSIVLVPAMVPQNVHPEAGKLIRLYHDEAQRSLVPRLPGSFETRMLCNALLTIYDLSSSKPGLARMSATADVC